MEQENPHNDNLNEGLEALSIKLESLVKDYNTGLDNDIEFKALKAIHMKIKELKALMDTISSRK